MRFDAIYILRGRAELRELITRAVDGDFADVLCEPICIRSQEGGRTAWSHRDHTLKVKILYLASLSQWDVLETEAGFRTVFGEAQRDEDFFDCWWTIERLEIDDDVDGLTQQFAAEFDRMPDCSSPLVRAWMQDSVKKGEPERGGNRR